jgi:transcriptional regulator EpsA
MKNIEVSVASKYPASVKEPANRLADETQCVPPLELSAEEEKHFLELAISASVIGSVSDYREWMKKDVRPLFPHGIMISGIGSIIGNQITIDCLIGVDYPQRYIDRIPLNTNVIDRPVIGEWYRLRKPQLIDESPEGYTSLSVMEYREVVNFGLRNIAAHGLVDLEGRKCSYFCFSQIPGRLTLRHGQLLELLVPHMHQALLKATHSGTVHDLNASQTLDSLSPRECDILAWMITGKTNREIANRIKRSEMTIRNHVHAILTKLGTPNRTQAVSKAIGLGFKIASTPRSLR